MTPTPDLATESDLSAVTHHDVAVNGVTLHVAEQGEGPLVLLLHGFPETWYSWRHQLAPLAAAGFRVVAVDQRGYARSDAPEGAQNYTLLHLVADVTALVGALGHEEALLVGHDWGAPVAWTAALLRPDLVRAVAGLSVPPMLPAGLPSTRTSRRHYGEGYYQNYFQAPGVADRELGADPAATMRRLLVGASGDAPGAERPGPWVVPEGATLLDTLPEPDALPGWLSAEDVETFAADHARHGAAAFTGGLNWYRAIDANQELLAAFRGLTITVPALYVVGDRDMVAALDGVAELRRALPDVAPRLQGDHTLPGCGHWTQQERPDEVNELLTGFLRSVA